jgi:hypothetical protein
MGAPLRCQLAGEPSAGRSERGGVDGMLGEDVGGVTVGAEQAKHDVVEHDFAAPLGQAFAQGKPTRPGRITPLLLYLACATTPCRNIEIKARDENPRASLLTSMAISAEEHGTVAQRDTHFAVPNGALKLREEQPGADRPSLRGTAAAANALWDVRASRQEAVVDVCQQACASPRLPRVGPEVVARAERQSTRGSGHGDSPSGLASTTR